MPNRELFSVTSNSYSLGEIQEEQCDTCKQVIKDSNQYNSKTHTHAYYINILYKDEILEYFLCSKECMKKLIEEKY